MGGGVILSGRVFDLFVAHSNEETCIHDFLAITRRNVSFVLHACLAGQYLQPHNSVLPVVKGSTHRLFYFGYLKSEAKFCIEGAFLQELNSKVNALDILEHHKQMLSWVLLVVSKSRIYDNIIIVVKTARPVKMSKFHFVCNLLQWRQKYKICDNIFSNLVKYGEAKFRGMSQ